MVLVEETGHYGEIHFCEVAGAATNKRLASMSKLYDG